jgi:hypothetical protein
MSLRRVSPVLVLHALLALLAKPASAFDVTIEVEAGESDRIETPVCAPIVLPAAPGPDVVVELEGPEGKAPGQLAVGNEKGSWVLWWVASVKKGQKATYRAKIEKGNPPKDAFAFQDEKGQCLDLLFGGRKVTRFMYAYDTSTKERRFETYKCFTHVFDSKGERLITNGHGGPFPHHRGIFIGWTRVTLPDGKTRCNFWEMGGGVCQRLDKLASQEAGPVLGRMQALVRWEDSKGEPVILEEREIAVYRQSKPELLLDFVSTLRSQKGDLMLDGDPEHGGCQFRAHSDVGAQFKDPRNPASGTTGRETKYLLLPGMKEGAKGTLDMPWAAVSFVLGESRFNVAHLNHPENPKGTAYSANRPYGRFGAFPRTTLKADQPLTLRYRFLVREGQEPLTADEAQRLYDDFAKPPKVAARQ